MGIDVSILETLTDHMAGRVRYHMGAKAPSLDCDSADIHQIDCSGFVRYAVAKSTDQRVIMPDGSVAQHEWCDEQGLKVSDFESGKLQDGAVRLAFLPPTSSLGPGERHVMLLHMGHTLESHGRTDGVSRREWGSEPWMQECAVYVCDPPQ